MMFWILLGVRRVKKFHGQMFLVWIGAYPVIRSIIEMFRGDKERGIYFYLSTSQWISILVAGSAVALYFHLRKRRAEQLAAPS
jgi:phosphatidylglycerol:prolipoprotein diacylglycerol transferase